MMWLFTFQGAASITTFEIMPRPPPERARDNPWPTWPAIFRVDYGHAEVQLKFGKDPRVFNIMSKVSSYWHFPFRATFDTVSRRKLRSHVLSDSYRNQRTRRDCVSSIMVTEVNVFAKFWPRMHYYSMFEQAAGLLQLRLDKN
jgi:hypothetical protein